MDRLNLLAAMGTLDNLCELHAPGFVNCIIVYRSTKRTWLN